jgi:AcrR family transcriptional regulator
MKDDSTEAKILEAARHVFIRKGMDGTRMQEIADEAGINKALLHYYYRSKEKLFEAVFQSVFAGFFREMKSKLVGGNTIEEKVEIIVDQYTNLLDKNPFVPHFIINEINRNPLTLTRIMEQEQFSPQLFIEVFGGKDLQKKGLDPSQLIVSLMGMMIFPYAARNLVQLIYFKDDASAYENFLQERKIFLKQMILKMIKA